MQKNNEYSLAFSLKELIHKSSVNSERFWEIALDLAVLLHTQIDIKPLLLERDIPEINRQVKELKSSLSLGLDGIDVDGMLPGFFELKESELQEIYKEFAHLKLLGMKVSASLYYALSELPYWSLSASESLVSLVEKLAAPKGSEKILMAGESCVGAAYQLRIFKNISNLNLLPLVNSQKQKQLRKLLFIEHAEVTMIPKKEIPFISNASLFNAGILMDAFGEKKFQAQLPSRKYKALSSEVSQLEFFLDHVDGRIVVLVPMGWLWKTAGDDFLLKQGLLESRKIEAVIQLPQKILKGTSAASALLILNTAKKCEKVAFIDASDEKFVKQISRKEIALDNIEEINKLIKQEKETDYSRLVSLEEIRDINLNLDPKRYVISSQDRYYLAEYLSENLVRLDSIADVIVCQPIKTEMILDSDQKTVDFISPSDINDVGQVEVCELSFAYPEPGQEKQLQRLVLKEGDLLFSTKGVIGKCGIVTKKDEGNFASQSFVIIRLKEDLKKTLVPTLFLFLQSETCKVLMERAVTGAAMKFVKAEDVRSLKVPLPSVEQQEIYKVEYEKLIELEAEKQKLEAEIYNELNNYWSFY